MVLADCFRVFYIISLIQVVIPCPDFLYTSACIKLEHSDEVLHFTTTFKGKLPFYASLGIYDHNGRCSDILSHPQEELDVYVISHANQLSEEEIVHHLDLDSSAIRDGRVKVVYFCIGY